MLQTHESPMLMVAIGPSVNVDREEPTTARPTADADVATVVATSPRALAWRRFKRDRVAVASGVFCSSSSSRASPARSCTTRAIGHGPNDLFPYAVSVGLKPVGPLSRVYATSQLADAGPFALEHKPPRERAKTLLLLGADSRLGRDEFLRILYGGRVTLTVAILAAAVAILIGTVLGCIAGFFGRWVDAGVSRVTDLMMAFPVLLFLVMLGSAFESGLTHWTFGGLLNDGVFQLIVLIALFTWFYPARIVRTQVLSLRAPRVRRGGGDGRCAQRRGCSGSTSCRTSSRRSSRTRRSSSRRTSCSRSARRSSTPGSGFPPRAGGASSRRRGARS